MRVYPFTILWHNEHKAGVTVVKAVTAADALELFQKQHPSALISWMKPGWLDVITDVI